MKTPADCRVCGVCCHSQLATFVRVTGEDWTRLGPEADWLAHFVGNRAYMQMHEGHCAALVVGRNPGGTTDFFCSIYERRPQICRDLERGSAQCLGERDAKSARLAKPSPVRGEGVE